MQDSISEMNALPRVCQVRLQAVYPVLKRAERRAADWLMASPNKVAEGTISEAKEASGSSETTWFRLAKRLGYDGFHGLRLELQQHFARVPEAESVGALTLYENIHKDSEPLEVAKWVFEASIQALSDTLNVLDEAQFIHAVDALNKTKKILFCGVGDAYGVAHSAYHKFFRAGFDVYENADQDLQLVGLSRLSAGDVIVAISYSGRTRSVLELARVAKERGCVVIALTNFPASPLTKQADIVLLTAAFTRYRDGEIVSKRITQLCIIESLYINLLLLRGGEADKFLQESAATIDTNKQ